MFLPLLLLPIVLIVSISQLNWDFWQFCIFTGTVCILAEEMAYYFSKATVEIRLTPDSYQHIWLKKFFFSKEKNFKIKWEEMVRVFYGHDRLCEWIVIELESGIRYKINRLKLFIPFRKDEFKSFKKFFSDYILDLNKERAKELIIISDPYQRRDLILLMLIISLVCLSIFIFNLLTGNDTDMRISIGGVISGLLWIILKIKGFNKSK